ncbi:11070_t:CDS:2 [Entrophospora sp. SA101]|nr:13438_t:CDS:2 [Entrophospora sp. SA101]CAJ0757469.1 11070_t:CDS:2 [Entrophospora sp. SA101]
MSSSGILQCFQWSRSVTCRVLFLQPQNPMLRNLRLNLFPSYLSRSYAISTLPPPRHTSPDESASSNWKKLTSITAKRLPTAILAKIFVTGFLGFISVDLLYAWYRNWHNERLITNTIEKGTRPETDVSDDEFVPRPLVVERLKRIFQPYKNQSFYHMVCGEHGTGKTTLTRISAKEVGQGVIYVDIPANIMQLGEAIGKAINFSFEEDISFTAQLLRKILGDTSKKIDYPEWVRALDAFKHASIIYKKKYGKPPIIVYDNISQLVYKNPEILDILQDDAKNNADDRKYIAVFVSSEGSVPRRMESRNSWSRAKKPVMEIGDLSEKESMDYLVNKRKISSSEANKIYELVGGRIVELKAVADDFLDGKSFKVIKWQILTEVEKKFKNAQLYENQPYHEVGKRVINSLLKSKELSYITYMKFFNRAEESDKMLEYNVFAYHPEKNTVTFQSQSVEYYIRENANMFLK